MRNVFDASTPSSLDVSLNDILCVEPKRLTDIRDILLKCCLEKFMFTANIKKNVPPNLNEA